MKKLILPFLIIGNIASLPFTGHAESPKAVIPLDQRGKTVLMADDAEGANQLSGFNPGTKRIWMDGWQKAAQALSWDIAVPEDGEYEFELVSCGIPDVRVSVGTGSPLEAKIKDPGWNRNMLGVIRLKKGKSTLKLQLSHDLAGAGKLRSLDLIPVAAKEDYEKRVKALRSDTSWMRHGGYGVMLQYGGWGYPVHGPKKPWEQVVKEFDVEKFAKMVDEDMGARWVIWSITYRDSHFPMPLKTVDAIAPGHTTTRDLPADLAAALGKRGIKLMFYYHPGYEDPTWWAANWKDTHDKALFIKNWKAVISEIGDRYGDRLAGWFFDDACSYSPAPFEEMTKAAKTGFAGRLVTYNDWILPSHTDFQDIFMGEGFTGSAETAVGSDGIYPDGPHKGLQSHGMFIVDGPDWAVWHPDTICHLVINADRAVGIVKRATKRGQVMSLDFNMYQDGEVAPATLEMFRKLKAAVYAPSPVSEDKPATASGQWAAQYGADKVVDGDIDSFWAHNNGERTGWLSVDLGKETGVSRAIVYEVCSGPRVPQVTKFAVEVEQADGSWKAVVEGAGIGSKKELKFAPVKARKFRLHILDSKDVPVIGEFQLFTE